MERTMSVEDRIRRAEEIYYRKMKKENSQIEHIKSNLKKDKKEKKIVKKMINQILIILTMYCICYLIISNNYVFTEDFKNQIKEILSKNIDLSTIYTYITTKCDKTLKNILINDEQKKEETTQEEQKQNLQNNEQNIGGGEEKISEQSNLNEISSENLEQTTESANTETNKPAVEKTQMEIDVQNIKNTVNFIKPIQGIISSKFGERNPTTSTVPKNHTGTDIAANTGTKILSATDGTVILASSEGDYGNHLKIKINDVIIVYAHCNKLYVKQGDQIKQGQEIAEVGSTGNSTGPHLHFEVRYQDRYIDPQLILEL